MISATSAIMVANANNTLLGLLNELNKRCFSALVAWIVSWKKLVGTVSIACDERAPIYSDGGGVWLVGRKCVHIIASALFLFF